MRIIALAALLFISTVASAGPSIQAWNTANNGRGAKLWDGNYTGGYCGDTDWVVRHQLKFAAGQTQAWIDIDWTAVNQNSTEFTLEYGVGIDPTTWIEIQRWPPPYHPQWDWIPYGSSSGSAMSPMLTTANGWYAFRITTSCQSGPSYIMDRMLRLQQRNP